MRKKLTCLMIAATAILSNLNLVQAGEPVAPTVPDAPAITVPAATKPIVEGEYVIYHPVTGKYLTNNGSGSQPVLNSYGFVKTKDAFAWKITVAADEKITMQQLSSSKFMGASSGDTWSIVLGNNDENAKWIPADVTDGYHLASVRKTGNMIGVDNTSGDNIGIYYDKGTNKNPLFQFIKKSDFYTTEVIAYEEALVNYKTATAIYNAKVALKTDITNATQRVADHPAEYSEAATTAFNNAVDATNAVYLNDEATLEQIAAAKTSLWKATNTYLMSVITAPANISFLITNPAFQTSNAGWTVNNVNVGGDFKQTTIKGKTCWNSWSNNFTSMDIYQDIEGLPAGVYSLTCYTTTDGNIHDQRAYATTTVGKTVSNLPAYKFTGSGFNENTEWEQITIAKIIVGADGKMRIGMASTSGGGTSGWFCVTGFELTYLSAMSGKPVAPALPGQTKPVVNGDYVIYHPASNKYLSNNGDATSPVLNNYGYLSGHDPYTWTIAVTDDKATIQQVSTSKYAKASTNGWSMLLGTDDADAKFILNDVTDGYTITSVRKTGNIIGVDGLTGDNINIYYDKGSDKNPLFKFFKKSDFFSAEFIAYEAALKLYEAKAALLAALTKSNETVANHPAAYSTEATTNFNNAMQSAKEVYLNGEATLEEVQAATVSLPKATNTYLMSVITANDENPANVSFIITNPGFDNNNGAGWTGAIGGAGDQTYEMYEKSNFNMYQVIPGLPAGFYELNIHGFARAAGNDGGSAYRAGTEEIKAYLYALAGDTESKNKIQSLYSETATGTSNGYANSMGEANTAFQAGKYANNSVIIFLEEGDALTIGVKYDGAHAVGSWTIFDNFKLTYKGNTLNTLIKEVEAVIAQAEAVEGVMQNTVSAALTGKISEAKTLVADESPTKEALDNMKTELEEAIANAQASIKVYAKLHTAIEVAKTTSVAANTSVVAAIATAQGVYDGKTVNEEGIDAAITALKAAINNAIVSSSATGDVTELITNPNIMHTAGIGSRPTGWENCTHTNTNGNFTKSSGSVETPVNTFLEVWGGDAAALTFDYHQIIVGIPNGEYILEAATFAESSNEKAVLYANEATTPMFYENGVNGNNMADFVAGAGEVNTSVTVMVTNNTLRIGIKNIDVLNGSWHGADSFRLTYVIKTGLNNAQTDAVKIYVKDYTIVVEGADSYAIYNQLGMRVASNTQLTPGVYIVKTAETTKKVVVK